MNITKRRKDELPGGEPPALAQLRAALEDLGDCWMYRMELIKHYGLATSTVDRYRHHFPNNQLRFGSQVIWSGSPETITHLKGKLNG